MMWFTTLALIVLIIYLVREQRDGGFSKRSHSKDRRSPLEVLDRKYAAGELTTDEYLERKEKLLEDQL